MLRERESNPPSSGYEPDEMPLLHPAGILYTQLMANARLMRIAILGFGEEGKGALAFLRNTPRFRDAEFWVLDQNAEIEKGNTDTSLHFQTGPRYLDRLSRFHLIVRSPGIPLTLPGLVKAKQNGVKITSATILFFEALEDAKNKNIRIPTVIGITGSKGKGTTTTLLYEIMKESGFRVEIAGNIGIPMLNALPEIMQAEYVILELSSFQLQDLHYSPQIAVILDIFPEHLDAHRTLREYLKAKANIVHYQTPRDRVFFMNDNPLSRTLAMESHALKSGINPASRGIAKNYEIAEAVAQFLECPQTVITRVTKEFKGLSHRIEKVKTIRGITFYNDSAATNPYATALAVRSIEQPIVLIVGGKDKNLEYAPLGEAITESNRIAGIILIGENKEKIKTALKAKEGTRPLTLHESATLKDAIHLAYKLAKEIKKQQKISAITILFSPASASFDMFKNYKDRGDQFKTIVKAIR